MAFEAMMATELVTFDAMRSLSMIVELIRGLVRLIGCGKWARRSMSFMIESVVDLVTVDEINVGDFDRLLLLRFL